MVEVASEKKIHLYVTTPLDGKARKFYLHRLEGEEHVSAPFHYGLTLKSDDNRVGFSSIVGQRVTVVMEEYEGGKRLVNGVVTRFTQAENDVNFTTYHAEIRPWLWELTLTTDSRIFQNMTVTAIISKVFDELGYTDYSLRTTASYSPREYCVQYQESAFDFVSRLMEDEGIFYFFEHSEGVHTLVLGDDPGVHPTCPNLSSAHVLGVSADYDRDDVVGHCTYHQEVITNRYAAEDFNFETPSTELFTTVDGLEKGGLRVYEYPGKYMKKDQGEAIIKKRMESRELVHKTLKGEGCCRDFIAGYKFDLKEHARQELNTSYVLRSLFIDADQARYVNRFEAFPSDVPFRPPVLTKSPRIPGTQTAIVVGKSGEEIWTDHYGRIKVQFHWDQEGANDERSSCWIRVAQVWAGKSWGGLIIPRIGQEVVVSFLEGDPDRPLVIGCVYNADQVVPCDLPADQTRSTLKSNSSKGGGGFNEIRFEDKKEAEEIYVHAQKDMNITVENDRTKEVLNQETNTIKVSRTTTIQEQDDTLTVSKGNRVVKIDTGNETHTVKGDFVLTVDGNLTIDVKGSVSIKSGLATISEAGTSMTVKAGTSMNSEAGTSMTNKAVVSMTNDGGVSLTSKASASQTVDGGGLLALKGGMVKIN